MKDSTASKNNSATVESSSSYRAIFDASEDPIFVHDWDTGTIIDVNTKACEVFGLSRQQLLAITIEQLNETVTRDTGVAASVWIERAKREGMVHFEWRRRTHDGSQHWDEVRMKRAEIAGKMRILAFTREITERKQAEEALRASEEQYRSIFHAFADGLLLLNRQARVIDVNPAFAAMVGATIDEVLAAPSGKFVAPESIPTLDQLLKAASTGEPFEAEALAEHRDGHMIPVNIRSVPVVYHNEGHNLTIVRDISRRIERQQQLARSEHRLRATIESSQDSIIAVDADERILEFNPAAEETFRMSARDAIGKDFIELFIPERFRTEYRSGIERLLPPDEDSFVGRRINVVARRADGEEFDAELWISLSESAEGQIVIAFLRDLTAQKAALAQHENLQAQLRQAQKMEAIGLLAGGIAHDFNNLLTSLTGYVAMAQDRLRTIGEQKGVRHLDKAMRSAERARNLVQQLLVFSRGQRGAPTLLDLTRHLREFEELLRSTLPSSLHFGTDYDPHLPPVMVDPTQLDQVLMNLCINARDAMDAKGSLIVGIHQRSVRNGICTSCRKEINGEFIELCVTDSGPGVQPALLERIFDPFFTTKVAGKGTGMGLSTTHGIVHDYGGHIIVDTALGKGSAFRVLLPRAEGVAETTSSTRASAARQGSVLPLRGDVLLVDDDVQVLEFMDEQLREWGLVVHAFSDPRAALESVMSGDAAFDVALLDQTMPGMSGLEMARALCELVPDPRVVLYTGYCDPIPEEDQYKCCIRKVLHKPVDSGVLLRLLRDMLQR